MNRYIIDKILHRLLCIKWHLELDERYRKVLRLNKIVGTNREKGKCWLAKWRKYKIPISSVQYRVFCKYIGDDINIVPEEVSKVCECISHHRLVALNIVVDKTRSPRLIEYNVIPGSFGS